MFRSLPPTTALTDRPRSSAEARASGSRPSLLRRLIRVVTARADGERGFTVIEVLASALVLAILSAGVAGSLVSSTDATYQVRVHSEAQALAEQSQDKLRALNINELSNLNQSYSITTPDNVKFTVTETGQFVSNTTGTTSCTSPATDYVKATSTVTWTNMGTRAPVVVTSILTPQTGSITGGNLSVTATNAAGTGVQGLDVSLSGQATGSAVTDANGCAFFGNMSPGTYTVSIYPTSGTYVVNTTGASVTLSSPATQTATVTAGENTSAPFTLDQAGSITYSFADAFPTGLTPTPSGYPTPTAPAVAAFNTGMNSPSVRICTLNDNPTCPVVGSPDTKFPASDWTGTSGDIVATPLFPFTSAYSVYAGTCTNDDPHTVSSSVTDTTAVVPEGGAYSPTPPLLYLPAIVLKLMTGTSASPGSEEAMPAGAYITVNDSGCAVDYSTQNNSSSYSSLSSGQAALPVLTTSTSPTAALSNFGILQYPGMPDGSYYICYGTGTTGSPKYIWGVTSGAGATAKPASPITSTLTSSTTGGEVVTLYAGSTKTTAQGATSCPT